MADSMMRGQAGNWPLPLGFTEAWLDLVNSHHILRPRRPGFHPPLPTSWPLAPGDSV